MSLTTVFERVANWNSQRYSQQFNAELAIALLKEEGQEFFDAPDEVECVDALADIVYVAMGAIWKLGYTLDESTIKSFIPYYQTTPFNVVEVVDGTCAQMRMYPGSLVTSTNLHVLIAACFVGLCMNLNSEDRALRALLAVCDSNDSKEVKKTSSDVKANGTSKGPNYFSPTAELTLLLMERDDVQLN